MTTKLPFIIYVLFLLIFSGCKSEPVYPDIQKPILEKYEQLLERIENESFGISNREIILFSHWTSLYLEDSLQNSLSGMKIRYNYYSIEEYPELEKPWYLLINFSMHPEIGLYHREMFDTETALKLSPIFEKVSKLDFGTNIKMEADIIDYRPASRIDSTVNYGSFMYFEIKMKDLEIWK